MWLDATRNMVGGTRGLRCFPEKVCFGSYAFLLPLPWGFLQTDAACEAPSEPPAPPPPPRDVWARATRLLGGQGRGGTSRWAHAPLCSAPPWRGGGWGCYCWQSYSLVFFDLLLFQR